MDGGAKCVRRVMVETKTKFETALADVSKIYAHPRAIVEARDLTTARKIELLKQWEIDLRQLQVASEEGMTGEGRGQTAELLRAVHVALTDLGVEASGDSGAPTKTGGI